MFDKAIRQWRVPREKRTYVGGFSLIHTPRLEVLQPRGHVSIPKHPTLWVAHSCLELETRVESYEDWRVRQAEETVLGVSTTREDDDKRRQRGRDMALDVRIHKTGLGLWSVPSHATSHGRRLNLDQKLVQYYEVDTNLTTCTCIDYARRKKRCKHIYAIEHLTNAWGGSSRVMQQSSKAANFALSYGVTLGKLAALSGLRSGRFSSSKPNLAGMPRPDPKGLDFAAFEKSIATAIGIPTSFLQSAKVSHQIHDEIIITLEVQAPKPAAAVTFSLDVAYAEK